MSIIPHLSIKGAHNAIAFYQDAFGASVDFQMNTDDGEKVMHASLDAYGSVFYLADDFSETGTADVAAPEILGGTSVNVFMRFSDPGDVDLALDKAKKAGAEITMPAQDMFWGDRYGRLKDPFGHSWAFGAPTNSNKE